MRLIPGKPMELLKEITVVTGCTHAHFDAGERVFFFERDPACGHFVIFMAGDGWRFRLHEDVLPVYLKELPEGV